MDPLIPANSSVDSSQYDLVDATAETATSTLNFAIHGGMVRRSQRGSGWRRTMPLAVLGTRGFQRCERHSCGCFHSLTDPFPRRLRSLSVWWHRSHEEQGDEQHDEQIPDEHGSFLLSVVWSWTLAQSILHSHRVVSSKGTDGLLPWAVRPRLLHYNGLITSTISQGIR